MNHALVTGAGSGIGALIATHLAHAGYSLSLLGRRMQPLEQTGAQINGTPSQAISCDVAQEVDVARAFAQASAAFGPVEVLVNCAGSMREQQNGRIINIASTAALKGYAYVSAYCAAKHGVLGLTRALALETAKLGITVNAICPGYTDTEIIRGSVAQIVEKTGRSEEQALAQFTNTNPQGRLIQPDEIASTVLWLCSEAARSVTGQAISISGGETM